MVQDGRRAGGSWNAGSEDRGQYLAVVDVKVVTWSREILEGFL